MQKIQSVKDVAIAAAIVLGAVVSVVLLLRTVPETVLENRGLSGWAGAAGAFVGMLVAIWISNAKNIRDEKDSHRTKIRVAQAVYAISVEAQRLLAEPGSGCAGYERMHAQLSECREMLSEIPIEKMLSRQIFLNALKIRSSLAEIDPVLASLSIGTANTLQLRSISRIEEQIRQARDDIMKVLEPYLFDGKTEPF